MKKWMEGFFNGFLGWVERSGNALPHPATLFAVFALLAILASGIGSWLNLSAVHPGTQEVVSVVNLMTVDGLHRMLLEMVHNFTNFAPLGIVLVAMLGIGIAECSGLISACIRLLVLSSPKQWMSPILVFAGVMSNAGSDVGYVLLIPLAGVIFAALNRHPIAGMAAAFAGVSGGFSANLLLGTIDPLLAGLSEEAAHFVDPAYTVDPTANYYFMAVSTFMITGLGAWVTDRIVEPRLGSYQQEASSEETLSGLSDHERKGLVAASIMGILILGFLLWGILPDQGFLRAGDGSVLKSPLIKGIVSLLFFSSALMGLAYGFASGSFKNDDDVIRGMGESMKSMGMYLVLVFFAAQFVNYFKWSHLGTIFSIKGAAFLSEAGLGLMPLMVLFILLSALLNLLMGSASAKWALLAPIFVPMFMILGYSPELTQVVFRIGDSITNIISPMMSFFALIIAFFQKYDKQSGMGTIIATMLPYSLVFFVGWVLLLFVFVQFDLPIGPGVSLHYELK
jgi:aminobenzoyl-glutamate transport protein